MVSSCYSTVGIRRVNLFTHLLTSHDWGKDRNVITTNDMKTNHINRVASIGFGQPCLREENLRFNNNCIIWDLSISIIIYNTLFQYRSTDYWMDDTYSLGQIVHQQRYRHNDSKKGRYRI